MCSLQQQNLQNATNSVLSDIIITKKERDKSLFDTSSVCCVHVIPSFAIFYWRQQNIMWYYGQKAINILQMLDELCPRIDR